MFTPQHESMTRRLVVLMLTSSREDEEEAFSKGLPGRLPLKEHSCQIYLNALRLLSFFFQMSIFNRYHVLNALRIVLGAFLNGTKFVITVLSIIRNGLRRFLIVVTVFPAIFIRLFPMYVRDVQMIRLQIHVRRLGTFKLNRFRCLKHWDAKRTSTLTRGRIPHVIICRHPALLSLCLLRRIRRDRVLRVLTREDRREEVARLKPCVFRFIRRRSRRIIRARFQLILATRCRISTKVRSLRINRRKTRRTAQRATLRRR